MASQITKRLVTVTGVSLALVATGFGFKYIEQKKFNADFNKWAKEDNESCKRQLDRARLAVEMDNASARTNSSSDIKPIAFSARSRIF